MKNVTCHAVVIAMIAGMTFSQAEAQTTVVVDSFWGLTQEDLENGEYEGQTFTLGTDTTFDVRDLGNIDSVGSLRREEPFSFEGATVNLSNGGSFDGYDSYVSDVIVNVQNGGRVSSIAFDGSTVMNVQADWNADLWDVVFYGSSVVNLQKGGYVSGLTFHDSSVLNISAGVSVSRTGINDSSVVNVLGGSLDLDVLATSAQVVMSSGRLTNRNTSYLGHSGGSVTITGGYADLDITTNLSSTFALDISGGTINLEPRMNAGNVTFTGGEFMLNGAAVSDLSAGIVQQDVLTGTLADGTGFILGGFGGDYTAFAPGVASLVSTPLPSPDTTPIVVDSGTFTEDLREGQTLTVVDGGRVADDLVAVGATLNIEGGTVGYNMKTAYSTVHISGGEVGNLDTAHISGGNITFFDGSVVDISGGLIRGTAVAMPGSTLDISGGEYERDVLVRRDSDVTIRGADFELNGQAVSDLSGGVGTDEVFTGTLADGTVFIFSEMTRFISENTTTLVQQNLGPIDTTPMFVSSGVGPKGLRRGQSLTLSGTGSLGDNFAAVGSTVHIEGGTVGENMEFAYSTVDISGGVIEGTVSLYGNSTAQVTGGEMGGLDVYVNSSATISQGQIGTLNIDSGQAVINGGAISSVDVDDAGTMLVNQGDIDRIRVNDGSEVLIRGGKVDDLNLYEDSIVNVEGGVVGDGITTRTASVYTGGTLNLFDGVIGSDASVQGTLNITGGEVGSGLDVSRGTVNMSGGILGPDFTLSYDSIFNLSGGTVEAGSIDMYRGAELNLFVLGLTLDGVPVDLQESIPLTIEDRDGVLLEATLADGNLFSMNLLDDWLSDDDDIDPDAIITATLVPEPASLVLLSTGIGVLCLKRRSVC